MDTVTAMAGLAFVFETQKRWDDAEPVLMRMYRSPTLSDFAKSDQGSVCGRLGRCLVEQRQVRRRGAHSCSRLAKN